jgi:hypothetical protein
VLQEYPEGPLQVLEFEIRNVARLVELELARTPRNDWVACVASRILVIQLALYEAADAELLTGPELAQAKRKLDLAFAYHAECKRTLRHVSGDGVPTATKEMMYGLLDLLDIVTIIPPHE